jgi:uncharacterized membrane protein (DUF4010 family)
MRAETDEMVAQRDTRQSGSRPVRRRREFPFAANLALGIGLLILGVLFFVSNLSQGGTGTRIFFLVGYIALAGFYLSRALRQYREKRALESPRE